jgi:hypothetical protein
LAKSILPSQNNALLNCKSLTKVNKGTRAEESALHLPVFLILLPNAEKRLRNEGRGNGY